MAWGYFILKVAGKLAIKTGILAAGGSTFTATVTPDLAEVLFFLCVGDVPSASVSMGFLFLNCFSLGVNEVTKQSAQKVIEANRESIQEVIGWVETWNEWLRTCVRKMWTVEGRKEVWNRLFMLQQWWCVKWSQQMVKEGVKEAAVEIGAAESTKQLVKESTTQAVAQQAVKDGFFKMMFIRQWAIFQNFVFVK